jgi:hypothetical protein
MKEVWDFSCISIQPGSDCHVSYETGYGYRRLPKGGKRAGVKLVIFFNTVPRWKMCAATPLFPLCVPKTWRLNRGWNSIFTFWTLQPAVTTPSVKVQLKPEFRFVFGATASSAPGHPHSQVYRSHTTAHQSVGRLWTSDQLVAQTSAWQQTTHTTDVLAPHWDLNPQSQQANGRRPRGQWDPPNETSIITRKYLDMKVAKSGVNTQALVQYNTTHRYFTRRKTSR